MPANYPVRNLPSSLMPQDCHNIRLLRLVSLPVTYEMISYIAWISESIVCDGDYSLPTPEPPGSPEIPDLEDFITHVCTRSNVYTATLLCVVIYLNRLRARMPTLASAAPGTPHRLFIASLIVAAKYLNDCAPKNIHWMFCANSLFDLREINLMEKQMLFLLDFKLSFTEREALMDWAPLL
ncbi:uncharacterized protein EI90DRAFT_2947895, partial [Cantharellus anzutake]|uniref:uncharacterized protein n=1 Tax=Cantharellus anzutake TaxID=1750568 RepID=UPI001904E2A0